MTNEDLFSQLGFNVLESEVYIALLKHGPQTAYKIAKLINKPTANVYKAVDVLATNGAIEVEENDVRVCSAIPIEALVKQLEMAYRNKLKNASDVLGKINTGVKQEGIYNLQTAGAVIQRAKEMMGRCKQVAVLDLFPEPLKLLTADIKKLSAKGKEVLLEVYSNVRMDNVSVSIPEVSDKTLKYWKAQQLNVSVDGKESLVALFNHDMSELIQATYSNNLYLSCMVYAGMRSEHQLNLLMQARSFEEIKALKKSFRFFYNIKVSGPELLFKQYKI